MKASTSTAAIATSYAVGGLRDTLDYEFRVAAQNRAGVSDFSAASAVVRPQEEIGANCECHQCFKLLVLVPRTFSAL